MSSKAKKLSVRVMAWILAILMILSLAVTAIVVIVDQVRANNEAVEHDHNGDGIPDHDADDHEDDHEDTDGFY